ncbi:MAG: GGDEF domain-containing phosphodiesterase, partial [Lachnospiraceae bacterium]|nr:GGDEF domain-containing phosphodiesterase [Lachnospiraceae bacterium]
PSALVYINLNGLKFYNKKYGFSEGDTLIKELARLIANLFGEENCSRFGQDHFAVFTEETDLEKKLKKLFNAMKTANGGKTLLLRVGIYPDSMGVVETSFACDRARYASNISRDDNNSYFNYFDQKMLKREMNRQYIIDNIDRAIAENWIKPFYQPIVRATNKKVCDEEALARWIDPEKGMLSPADFIPILEDSKLIYKVDLAILDAVLERIKNQMADKKMNVVPMSVNLSRTDFETCDIVREICNRVDAANVPRKYITIEITESVVGGNFDFMKEQVRRFQELGFPVWMDDFGSGYSSLDLLQEIQFDLIKFDMRFMRQFDTSPKSRIILTELMRMAVSLGIETVCEGVETAEQVEFLRERGCTKLQGYHFCKPISLDDIYERYRTGKQIGFENPDESEYQKVLSSINLYDLGSVSNDEGESVKHYFNTQPMAILECDGENVRSVRQNKSFSEFIALHENVHEIFMNRLVHCRNVGQRIVVSEILETGETVNALIRKLAENPISKMDAYAVAVLDITSGSDQVLTYTGVAQALSADYIDLYHIDLDTERYTQYSTNGDNHDISVARTGEGFFESAHNDARQFVYEDDRQQFIETFTKKNVLKALDENGAYTHTYRVMIAPREMDEFTQSYKQRSEGSPMYVSMKIVRLNRNGNHVVMAVNNVDAQMKQQELIDRLREETATYSRISALMGNFIGIYTVDPDTGSYMQYSASDEFADLGTSTLGTDFFADSRKEIEGVIAPEDYYYFMAEFTKENVLSKTADGGIYTISYHLMIAGKKTEINLRAGIVKEKDGRQLIVGIIMGENQ